MKIYRPLQISFNSRVLEQDRKFYFTASASMGIELETGNELLDINYLKDMFEAMGDNPLPDPGMPKPKGEFIVSGSFYPPGKKPVKGGEVKAEIGNLSKTLYIFGKRYWKSGLPSEPEEIEEMPLDYKYAFGGKDFKKNTDGIGYLDGILPCIEYPGKLAGSKNDTPDPAGLSPLLPMNPLRMKYNGTYDSDYMLKYYPGYPADHDWRYFLNTPPDQWNKEFFKGDETFYLKNMHPEKSILKGKLPGLYPRCFLDLAKKNSDSLTELLLNLDTVWFFPDKLICLLIFRGVAEVEDDEAESITNIILGYEKFSDEKKSISHYKAALEKRKYSDDDLLNNLKTKDLIPEGCKTAMEILTDVPENENESEFSKNIDQLCINLQKKIGEKTDDSVSLAQKNADFKMPPDKILESMPEDQKTLLFSKDAKPNLKEMMKEHSDPDTDAENFNSVLENLIPGITDKKNKNIDLSDFSFDKIDEILNETEILTEEKISHAEKIINKESDNIKNFLTGKIKNTEAQIESLKNNTNFKEDHESIKALEETKSKLTESIKEIENLDFQNSEVKGELPRFNSEEIKYSAEKSYSDFNPALMEALNHLNSLKETEPDLEKSKKAEKKNK
jgi:hypothetical protein